MQAILELPEYDEAVLAGRFKHLAVAKQHLYFLLLDDLLSARTERMEDTVRKGCDYIGVLRSKGLPRQAYKLLQRYKKKAYEYELYRPLLELIELEKKLAGNQIEEKRLEELFQEEAGVLEKMLNTNAYWRLASQIGRLQWQYQKMQGAEQQEALRRLSDDPLLADISQAATLQSKIYFHRARAAYYFTAGQHENAYQANRQLLDLLEGSPAFLKQFPEVYLQTFNNYLIDSLQLGKRDAFAAGLDKLSALSENPSFRSVKNLDAQLFRQRYLLEINSYLSAGALDKALALVPGIERGLDIHGGRLQKAHRVTFQYLLAYVLWRSGRGKQALGWIHQLIQQKEDVVLEIFQFARVLNLLVHFDLGNWEHLSYLLPSTRRYLRQRRELYRTEAALFQFLQRAINAPESQMKELKLSFSKEVETLAGEEGESRFFNYVDLRVWKQ